MITGVSGTPQYCSYFDIIKASAAASLVALIPYIGLVASWVVLFYILNKLTGANIGELIIMVVVSRIAALFLIPVILVAL